MGATEGSFRKMEAFSLILQNVFVSVLRISTPSVNCKLWTYSVNHRSARRFIGIAHTP